MALIEPEFMAQTDGLDVQAFWQENKHCWVFSTDKSRCALWWNTDDNSALFSPQLYRE
jgi:hypothetical protein